MKRFFTILSAALSVAMFATPSAAQHPSRPIRLVVPTPAGGPSDVAARALGQALSKSLGQPVIVENRPGAGGAIAAQAVLTAAPDGYTFLWVLASMAGIPMLQKSPPFQSLSELTPVSLVGSIAFGLFVHPSVPAQSAGELAAHLRSNPDKVDYGTATLGEYLATTQFLKATGTAAVRVPYRGGPQLMPDLLNGRVQMNIGPLSGGLPHVKENKLRLLGVLLPQRSPVAPDVPTLAEAGIRSVSLPTWQAILAPPRTPRAIAERMSRDVAQALNDPGLRGLLEQQSIQVQGLGPEELASVIARDTDVWRNFVRDYNIPQE